MKCQNCGADVESGVLFCRECGARVVPQKRFCRECGKEILPDARFCSYCGADLTIGQTSETTESDGEDEYGPSDDSKSEEIPTDTSVDTSKTFSDKETEIITVGDKIKVKLETFWNGLDLFTKVFTIVSAITCLLLLIAIISHSALAIFLSIVQAAGLVVAILWHRGILNSPKKWLKYVVLAAVILLTALNIMSYSPGKSDVSQKSISPTAAASESTGTNFLVLAPCASEDCIGQNYDTIKNEFISSGFTEISTKAVEDLLYSESEKVGTIESVSVGNVSDFTKDQQFNVSDRVEICYHAYKKAVVTIDVDFLSNLFFDKYGVVLYLNDEMVGKLAHGEDKTFSQEVEPGTYTLAVRREDDASCNGSLDMDIKGDVNISVQIKCQSDDILVDTLYIEKIGEVQAGEIMMPQAASSFKHLNYLDVQNTLEGLGFTNISTEILYDIYWGWTDEGETESVSINGTLDYARGDIFPESAPVIITYHMKIEKDPSRIIDATVNPETTQATNVPKTETYAVDKDLVVTKCERDAKYTTMYNIAFAERDMNGNCLREYSFDHCINPRTMGKQFNATGSLPEWFYVGAIVHVKANLAYGALSTTDVTVTQAVEMDTIETEVSEETKQMVVLPEPSSKLGKDYDFKSSTTVYYINVDGVKNKPSIQIWNGVTVTDGVAEYLETLKSNGYDVRITAQSNNTPYEGFTYYETYFEVSNSELKWTMYLNIQYEEYIEYELDINFD